jgi:hypothetical protein
MALRTIPIQSWASLSGGLRILNRVKIIGSEKAELPQFYGAETIMAMFLFSVFLRIGAHGADDGLKS